MIRSMTAYGKLEQSGDWGEASFEFRTVNHRYLKIVLRLPEELRFLDQIIRQRIGKYLKRGEVSCRFRLTNEDASESLPPINHQMFEKLIKTTEATVKKIKKPVNLNPLEVLQWPGILDKSLPEPEKLQTPILNLLEQTLMKVLETRQREGEKIKTIVFERCESAQQIVSDINKDILDIQNKIKVKLLQRAKELTDNFNTTKLEQELLLLAQRMGITEEVDRLNAHINRVKVVLEQDEPVGRQLDFLMQEMNREATTLVPKIALIDTTNPAIKLKVIIEQIREQVQNIE